MYYKAQKLKDLSKEYRVWTRLLADTEFKISKTAMPHLFDSHGAPTEIGDKLFIELFRSTNEIKKITVKISKLLEMNK